MRAFRGNGENAELCAQLLALTFGALRFVAAKDQSFELVLTFLADIFKNRHRVLSRGID